MAYCMRLIFSSYYSCIYGKLLNLSRQKLKVFMRQTKRSSGVLCVRQHANEIIKECRGSCKSVSLLTRNFNTLFKRFRHFSVTHNVIEKFNITLWKGNWKWKKIWIWIWNFEFFCVLLKLVVMKKFWFQWFLNPNWLNKCVVNCQNAKTMTSIRIKFNSCGKLCKCGNLSKPWWPYIDCVFWQFFCFVRSKFSEASRFHLSS